MNETYQLVAVMGIFILIFVGVIHYVSHRDKNRIDNQHPKHNDSELEAAMKAFERGRYEYRNALHHLANFIKKR